MSVDYDNTIECLWHIQTQLRHWSGDVLMDELAIDNAIKALQQQKQFEEATGVLPEAELLSTAFIKDAPFNLSNWKRNYIAKLFIDEVTPAYLKMVAERDALKVIADDEILWLNKIEKLETERDELKARLDGIVERIKTLELVLSEESKQEALSYKDGKKIAEWLDSKVFAECNKVVKDYLLNDNTEVG